MIEMKRWEIWYAEVKFEDDESQSGDRPVLVIEPGIVAVLKMTTHQGRDYPNPFEYEMMRWKKSGLSKKTFVKCDKFLKINEDCFRRKIGILSLVDIRGVEVMMNFHGLGLDRRK